MRYNLNNQTFQRLLRLPGVNAAALLTAMSGATKKIPATRFKKINLEKGMYRQAEKDRMTFAELLESMDPSEAYEGNDGGLDAFERQLVAHNLQVNGGYAINLEEWYNQPESRVLFPEFISRQIEVGKLIGRYTLNTGDLVAVVNNSIDSGVYENAILDMGSDAHMHLVAEGAEFPVISVTIGDKTVSLVKRGFTLKISDEGMRRTKANKFAVMLQLIGWNIELDKTKHAVTVLVNGNSGNNNAAVAFTQADFTYNNWVDFLAEFEPYEPRIWAAPKAGWAAAWKLSEFKDSIIASEFINTGNPISPFGNALKRHDPGTSILTNKLMGVDTTAALEELQERGSFLQETERLVTSEWNVIKWSMVIGYAKMIAESTRLWDYSNAELP